MCIGPNQVMPSTYLPGRSRTRAHRAPHPPPHLSRTQSDANDWSIHEDGQEIGRLCEDPTATRPELTCSGRSSSWGRPASESGPTDGRRHWRQQTRISPRAGRGGFRRLRLRGLHFLRLRKTCGGSLRTRGEGLKKHTKLRRTAQPPMSEMVKSAIFAMSAKSPVRFKCMRTHSVSGEFNRCRISFPALKFTCALCWTEMGAPVRGLAPVRADR
jgi:hypothetical protein